MEGIREKLAVEMGKLEEDISNLKASLQRQEDIIEQRLRVVSSDRKFSVSVSVLAEISVSVIVSVSVSVCSYFSVSALVQIELKFWDFGFGLNKGFDRTLVARKLSILFRFKEMFGNVMSQIIISTFHWNKGVSEQTTFYIFSFNNYHSICTPTTTTSKYIYI
jgi:hypothetical protein